MFTLLEWGHGSPVSWASVLPIFSFLCFSVLDLGSGMGQTDRQTTAINALCPTLWGAGIIIKSLNLVSLPSVECQCDLLHQSETAVTSVGRGVGAAGRRWSDVWADTCSGTH